MLRPSSTDEVASLLSYCHQEKIAVVPQGGNTGLVGGSIPVHDEVIINTSLMNKIFGFDKSYSIVQCEAGCVLENLQTYLEPIGYTMPLDLGAKGSC